MNNRDRTAMKNHASYFYNLWLDLIVEANGNSWHKHTERQICYDVLNSLDHNGMIRDFDTGQLTFVWGDVIMNKRIKNEKRN